MKLVDRSLVCPAKCSEPNTTEVSLPSRVGRGKIDLRFLSCQELDQGERSPTIVIRRWLAAAGAPFRPKISMANRFSATRPNHPMAALCEKRSLPSSFCMLAIEAVPVCAISITDSVDLCTRSAGIVSSAVVPGYHQKFDLRARMRFWLFHPGVWKVAELGKCC